MDVERVLDRLELDDGVARCGAFAAARARRASASTAFSRKVSPATPTAAASPARSMLAAQPLSALRPDLAGGDRARGPRRRNGQGRRPRPYLEELIVRRELSMNFVNFNQRYDSYDCLPDWAQETLRAIATTGASTAIPCSSSSAPRPTTATGMRRCPRWLDRLHAQLHAHVLGEEDPGVVADARGRVRDHASSQQQYFLDGRDANSYANVAWAFGLHDRPWPERPVFGKVRYMNARGSSASST